MIGSASERGSRILKFGSRRRVALVVAVPLAVVAGGLSLLLAPGARPAAQAKYGQIPSWLPHAKTPVGRVVTATPGRPWLAIEGDSVSVVLPHGRALATAVGPAVPTQGTFPLPATSPCTFTVTFTSASGEVRLVPGAFTIIDERGRLHHPRVTAASQGSPPWWVRSGSTVKLIVSGVLPTGNGRLRWAPLSAQPIVSWDFDVEVD